MMKDKLELIKERYKIAGREKNSVNDVIILVDFFLAIFSLKNNLTSSVESDLKLKVGPVMGGGDDVISAANFLKEDLVKGDKYTRVDLSGKAVLDATTILIEYVMDKDGLHRVYSKYESEIDRIIKSF